MNAILARLVLSVVIIAVGTARAASFSDLGAFIVTNLNSAPFPHRECAEGHKHKDQLYPAEPHYRDNTVAIFIPKHFRAGGKVDFVVHFHGWFNHVAKVLDEFKLIEQLAQSRVNAVLVVPQGPRDAPDSFGGRLEDPDGFKRFMTDVLAVLRTVPQFERAELGKVILSGHNGGYHVMAFILGCGGWSERVREVWLFDALYGQAEKFKTWQGKSQGRLVNIYTEQGGTKEETEKLMADLRAHGTAFFADRDNEAKPDTLRNSRLIFLHTDLGHNDVLEKRRTFRLLLETSCLPRTSASPGAEPLRAVP